MQYLLLFTAGIIRTLPVNETMGMAMIVVSAKCDFAMNVDRIALTTSASFFGKFNGKFKVLKQKVKYFLLISHFI